MLFPEDAFETKGIDGVAIKTLKRGFTSESNCLLDWIEVGVFDALERKYLKSLVFGIYLDKDKPFELVEEYIFEFNYFEDHVEFNLCSGKHEISKTTHQLIRRLLLMTQSLESLPDDAFITIRLFYFPHTPLSYEPPLFKKLDRVRNQDYASTVNLGSVKTPFHDFSLKIRTNCQQQVQDFDTQELKDELELNAELTLTQPNYYKAAKEASQSIILKETPETSKKYNCVCGLQCDFSSFSCCSYLHHKLCNPITCLSSKMPILPINDIKEVCLKKLALFHVLTTSKLDVAKKLGVSSQKTKELLDWMKSDGYINARKKIVQENQEKGLFRSI
ncbi:DNA binding protein [Boothiomyces sp. JEL0838]|nr:DNA binding protein [Boothiomyces sp. JEL0838]